MTAPYYAIYELINQKVAFDLPKRYGEDSVTGVVEQVYRDVIANAIEVTVKKSGKYIFSEPDMIVRNEGEGKIIFVYGSPEELSDDEFFEECRKMANSGYGIGEVFDALDKEHYAIVFKILPNGRQKIV